MSETRETRYILRTWYKALRDPEGYWFKRNLKWLYGGLKNVSEEDRLLLAYHYLSNNGRPLTVAEAAEMRLSKQVQPLIDADRPKRREFPMNQARAEPGKS